MLVEILVLGGDEGVHDAVGNGGEGHIDAPLAGKLGDQVAVIGVDAGHDRRLVFGEHFVVRKILRYFPQHKRRRGRHATKTIMLAANMKPKKRSKKPPRLRRRFCSGGLIGAVMSMVRPVPSPIFSRL